MPAAQLFQTLTARGCRLLQDGEQLRIQDPQHALTDDVRQAIREHKQELLTLLAQAEPANVGPPATPHTQEVCTHQAHFPPTPTDGPPRQCRHCSHVWQVPCACGLAAWAPTASWGADGTGVVVWTCKGCGVHYGPDREQSIQHPVVSCTPSPRGEAVETPPAAWRCRWCKGTRGWRAIYGAVVCGTCHPPADVALVAEWGKNGNA